MDLIDGIAPAVAIRQKNHDPQSPLHRGHGHRNPRLSSASFLPAWDAPNCPQCGEEVKYDTVDEVTERIPRPQGRYARTGDVSAAAHRSRRPELGAGAEKKPRGRRKKQPEADTGAALRERLFELRKRGFNRLMQAGELFEFSTPESLLGIDFNRPVFILLDRIVVDAESRSRIVDAVESGYREAGEVVFETAPAEGESPQLRFSQRFECKRCNLKFEQPEPRLFSFNNPYGACPRCQGFGNTIDFDMDLVIPDTSKTLAEGAVEPWTKPKYRPLGTEMRRFARLAGIPLDVPWANLKKEHQRAHSGRRRKVVRRARLLRASGEKEVQTACACLPEPLSRLLAVRSLWRSKVAQ